MKNLISFVERALKLLYSVTKARMLNSWLSGFLENRCYYYVV